VEDLLAIATVILWPVIPLFWIPVHFGTKIFRKLGLLTYVMPLVTWTPLAYLMYVNRGFLLQFKTDFPTVLNFIGVILFVLGTLLNIWTGRLLTLWGLIGLPEISGKKKNRFVKEGPFKVIRHPTYLAHTLMILGIYLYTKVIAVGIVALLDFIVINTAVIPLEDKELLRRFGDEYNQYKKKVPEFFPVIRLK
jgi:protein-S-isoprenylcysteine O-methyltransferase Ste14